MTVKEEKDLREVTIMEEYLRRKIAEVYPGEVFPYGLFSPQTAIWLAKQQMKQIERISSVNLKDEDTLQAEIEATNKKSEVLQLWQKCYNMQNS